MLLRTLVTVGALLAAILPAPVLAQARVRPGIEVLLTDSAHLIRGKRVGLLTNTSGRLSDGSSSIDALYKAPGVKLTALFGPEHGLRGVAEAGEVVATETDSATGVPIYSLYGATHVPTPEMLSKIDVLLFDIQDVGARFYTYQWTMADAAVAATKAGVQFIVLDRPNPIRADRFEGAILDTTFKSGVGRYAVPLRYGLTVGELARYLVGSGKITATITVVPMQGYRRSMWYDETGLPWVNPSPNIRTLDAALLYTGTAFYEAVNATEGRGTDAPFSQIGASWLTDAGAIAAELNKRKIPGVRFDSVLRPVGKGFKFGGETIPMIRVTVTNRNKVEATAVGAHLMQAVHARHKDQWTWRPDWIEKLTGSRAMRAAVNADAGIPALLKDWRKQSKRFAAESKPYWLYR